MRVWQPRPAEVRPQPRRPAQTQPRKLQIDGVSVAVAHVVFVVVIARHTRTTPTQDI